MNRRYLLIGVWALTFSFAPAALAANLAEDFVSSNIQVGFDILGDNTLSPAQRREKFATFLTALIDMKRVALFSLGRYATDVSQTDLDAFFAAYQEYVLTAYQSYFGLYAGQNLRVISSRERAPNDFVVNTKLVGSGATSLEVDFRVRTDGAKPILVDFAVSGLWLALAQRDQFLAVLSQNGGDIKALTAHLQSVHARK